MHYPLFYRRDLTVLWALFADNLANIVILSGICLAVFDMPAQIVFGRILPGLGVFLLAGLSFHVYAATFSGTAAFLTLIGIVHSPNLGMHFTTIFWGYVMMTALFVAAWFGKIEKDPEIGELDFKGN